MNLTQTGNEPPLDDWARDERAIALFLDFDGTLVEIAPSPADVRLDRRVPAALDRLRGHLSGALALVSGRPISFLDTVLAPYRFDTAALHGAEAQLRCDTQALMIAVNEMHLACCPYGICISDAAEDGYQSVSREHRETCCETAGNKVVPTAA